MNRARIRRWLDCVPLLLLLATDTYGLMAPMKLELRRNFHLVRSLPPQHKQQGEVGSGPNWIERSFPLDSNEGKAVGLNKVDDYDLGISGVSFQIGSLSLRLYDTILSQTSLPKDVPEILRGIKLYAMDFSAKLAVEKALGENGLQMVLTDDEEDEGIWGDVDSIRLLDSHDEPMGDFYDSWEEVVDRWTPGQGFNFVVRQVPARQRELSLDGLLHALDPKGDLRQQAKDAGMSLPDEGIKSLKDLATDNVRRTELSPRETTSEKNAFAGRDKRGYRPIAASDLSNANLNTDGLEKDSVKMHVMDALVSHGCLLVELDDTQTRVLEAMWRTTEEFFDKLEMLQVANLPGMTTIQEAGSSHAKVGFASYDDGNMQFLETRRSRHSGDLLPVEAEALLGLAGRQSLIEAFDVITQVAQDLVRIAVSASSVEAGVQVNEASQMATLLAHELLDDNKPLMSSVCKTEGNVGMSPHRLCRYSNTPIKQAGNHPTREIFGAHTDSTFVTAVPVAAVSGLEVFDESAEMWYRPEKAARKHWEKHHEQRKFSVETCWYSRYVVLMPGELLQLATRDEVPAAVHRVVATQDQPFRLSAPILLRGRPGIKLDVERYLKSDMGHPLIKECDGMTIEDIHDKMQPSSFG